MNTNVSFLAAFVAGVLSISSPCVLPLVPLQIGSALQGNVAADPQQGAALALGMVALMLVSLGLYFALERRNSRWRQR